MIISVLEVIKNDPMGKALILGFCNNDYPVSLNNVINNKDIEALLT
jgi:hypothetical protein